MRAIFSGVGRNKACFTLKIDSLDDLSTDFFRKRIRLLGGLMSKEVDLVHNGFGQDGRVVVGGLRHVGNFRVE